MPGFINSHGDQIDITVDGETIVRTNTDQIIFGEKTFLSTISGVNISGATGFFESIVVGGTISAPGGGVGGGGIDGGPIFVDQVTAPGGAVSVVDSLFNGEIIKEVSTAEDDLDVRLLIERGDSQNYRPTGVIYYQTGQEGQMPNLEFPYYINEMDLDPHPNNNGYSWMETVSLPMSSTLEYNDKIWWVFKNGERSTGLVAKKVTAPVVQTAQFIDQDPVGNQTAVGAGTSKYPWVQGGLNGQPASFLDDQNNYHDEYFQTHLKNGDPVKIKIITDLDFAIVEFGSDGGGVTQTFGSLASPLSTNEIDLDTTITTDGSYDHQVTFSVRVSDAGGNWSEVIGPNAGTSTDYLDANNRSPSIAIGAVIYGATNQDATVTALRDNSAGESDYETIYYYFTNPAQEDQDNYWRIDTAEPDLVEEEPSWYSNGNDLQYETSYELLVQGSAAGHALLSSGSKSWSPFTVYLLNEWNGKQHQVSAPAVFMQKVGHPVTLSANKVVRSGPAGELSSFTITSDEKLQSEDSGGLAVNSAGGDPPNVTVGTGISDISLPLTFGGTVTVKDSAARGNITMPTFDIIKLSGEAQSNITPSGDIEVRGFTLRTLNSDGATAANAGVSLDSAGNGIPNDFVVNPAKLKSGLGQSGGWLSLKIGTGAEGNFPYSAAVTAPNIPDASTAAEFGLNASKTELYFDSHTMGQVVLNTMVIRIEETI